MDTSCGSLFVRDSLTHSLTHSGCPDVHVGRNYVPLFGVAQSNVDLRYYVISRQIVIQILAVFCLVGHFCRALRPAPFWGRPALFKKPKLTKKIHTWLLAVLPFLLPTHSVDVLCIFYCAIEGHFGLVPFFFCSPR